MSENTNTDIKKNTDEALGTQQLIVFRQGNEEYGLHIDQIKEVVITPNITTMPQTSNYIKGVANIRGNIIAIIDLEEKFGIKSTTTTDQVNSVHNYTLVVESEELKIGILVTEVPNTLSVNSADIEESVNLIQDNNVDINYIQGIVKLEERLIILIDIFKVLNEKELDTLTTVQD